jgi:hypothetical protein
MWRLYTDAGYRGKYKTIKEAYDESYSGLCEEILLSRQIGDIVKIPQPFANNEKQGEDIGGLLCFLNGSICTFELPSEDTTMHIVLLTHVNNETHYLIHKDVAEFYFGDKDWKDYQL